mgnify:CR=1 FL=1
MSAQELRDNSWFGTEITTAYNGFTQLDSETISDSRYRERMLAWYRKDGGTPDVTDEDQPNRVIGSLGQVRLDGIDQINNFKAIANTDGFDLASTPHSMVVELYIGRVPNF